MSLFKQDLARYLAELGILYPFETVCVLSRLGLSYDLCWRVLLLGEIIPESLAQWTDTNLENQRRRALQRKLMVATRALGLRAEMMPQLRSPSRLPRPLLIWSIVRSVILGPETETDRANEARRLDHAVGHVLRLSGAFRCVICCRMHGTRAAKRCVEAHLRRSAELRLPPEGGFVARHQLVRLLDGVT
jgi:hypothetical protein